MRALLFTAYGGPEVLTWGDAPVPHAGPGQIRIAVRAASVNPVDWKILAGAMSGGQPLAGTGYLGYDAAGVVARTAGPCRRWRRSPDCWPRTTW
jgi:NADPH:quinone reductase-like Zn-dependent oxidoreductase